MNTCNKSMKELQATDTRSIELTTRPLEVVEWFVPGSLLGMGGYKLETSERISELLGLDCRTVKEHYGKARRKLNGNVPLSWLEIPLS